VAGIGSRDGPTQRVASCQFPYKGSIFIWFRFHVLYILRMVTHSCR